MSDAFRHTRDMPEEWAALTARAEELFPDSPGVDYGDRVTVGVMSDLYGEVSQLDNLALESNFYFALGRSMCQFGRILSDPNVRQECVTTGVRSLYETQIVEDGVTRGLLISRVGRFGFSAPFWHPAKNAVEQLSQPERLLGETLSLATSHRRTGGRDGEKLERAIDQEVEQHRKKNYSRMIPSINQNTLAGASIVLRKILRVRGGSDLSEDALLTDVITHDELRALDFRKLATNAARLRLDELAGHEPDDPTRFDEIVEETPEGNLHLDPKHLRTEPPELTPRKNGDLRVSRLERLECPALQAKLIPLALPILAEITIGADMLLVRREREWQETIRRSRSSAVVPELDPETAARVAEWALFT